MRKITRLVVGLLVGLCGYAAVQACTCSVPSQRERYRRADAVFLGEVIEFKERDSRTVDKRTDFFPYEVKFKVQKQWKGKRSQTITTLADFDAKGMCDDLDVGVGNKILVYAPREHGHLLLYRDCGPNQKAEYATSEIKKLGNVFLRSFYSVFPYPKL